MYQLTKEVNLVKCLDTGAIVPVDADTWQGQQYQAWLAAGNTPEPVPPPYQPYSAEHFAAIRESAWAWMTAWVAERRYDSIETCVGYFNSGVDRYRLEARAMVAWRDQVNQALEQLVLAPPVGVVTWDQVRPLLPQPETFGWPDEVALPLSINETAVLA
ncbi:hypothetical protein ABE494_07320 [Stenotrophomonas lactitubi]|uniref:hypothetical protein n=1 Tax=Stenotrophomonas lactitubi TaxID=2045214 RepID=UPI0032088908